MRLSTVVRPAQLAYVDGDALVKLDFYIHSLQDVTRAAQAVLLRRFGSISPLDYRVVTYEAPNEVLEPGTHQSINPLFSVFEDWGIEVVGTPSLDPMFNTADLGRYPWSM